MSVIIEIHVER